MTASWLTGSMPVSQRATAFAFGGRCFCSAAASRSASSRVKRTSSSPSLVSSTTCTPRPPDRGAVRESWVMTSRFMTPSQARKAPRSRSAHTGASCDYFEPLPPAAPEPEPPLPPVDLEAPALPVLESLALLSSFFSSFMHFSRSSPVRPAHFAGMADAPAEPLLLALPLAPAALSALGLLLLDCAQAAVAKARNAALTTALMSFADMRSSGWVGDCARKIPQAPSHGNAPVGRVYPPTPR